MKGERKTCYTKEVVERKIKPFLDSTFLFSTLSVHKVCVSLNSGQTDFTRLLLLFSSKQLVILQDFHIKNHTLSPNLVAG